MFERREEIRPAFAGAESIENSSIQIDPDFHVPGGGESRGAFLRAFRILFPKAS